MKKIRFIILLLALGACYSMLAQDHLEITAESGYSDISDNPENVLTISIEGDYPGYTIMLFDKEPWTGAEPIETIKDINDAEYRFQNLQPGIYHVCVLDAKENLDCQKVNVESR